MNRFFMNVLVYLSESKKSGRHIYCLANKNISRLSILKSAVGSLLKHNAEMDCGLAFQMIRSVL